MSEDPRRTRLIGIEQEKATIREQMAQCANQWKRAAGEWAKTEWQRDAQRAIERHPDKVKDLAASGSLSSLKHDLGELVEAADAKVAEHFDDAPIWSHTNGIIFETEGSPKRPDESYYESYNPKHGPRPFDEPLRRLKGEALRLLDEAGLLADDEREAARRGGGGYRYPYALGWSSELTESLAPYSQHYRKVVELELERERIEGELAREEAVRLWNRA